MHLRDSMQRGAAQRRTVYRISVTLVKKELLGAGGGSPGRERERRRRGGSQPPACGSLPRAALLLEEDEEEDEQERDAPGPGRPFRALSAGQLELGRLQPPARTPGPGPGRWARAEGAAGSSPARQPGLLRRSFSFRHRSGAELRVRARRHSSSGCLAAPPGPGPGPDKRNTLDVGEVLSQAEPLERWERSKGKNRTLDNSDLQRFSQRRDRDSDRDGAPRDRRLLRFFSGIFASTPFCSPHGRSPRSSFSRPRGYFSSLKRATAEAQSSSESINGSPHKGALPWRGRGGGRAWRRCLQVLSGECPSPAGRINPGGSQKRWAEPPAHCPAVAKSSFALVVSTGFPTAEKYELAFSPLSPARGTSRGDGAENHRPRHLPAFGLGYCH